MNNWWIKSGCFLTGYNYRIVRECSEIVAKAVKRYTSALVIICILWAFIGYNFTQRYLKLGVTGGIIGAILLCIIIVQVERQIILAVHRNRKLYFFRGIIALMMALIGTLIIDQILFKEDIEETKILMLDQKVNKLLPAKSAELRRQIAEIDSTIRYKDSIRLNLMADIKAHPTINVITNTKTLIPIQTITVDSANRQRTKIERFMSSSSTVSSIQNPNMALIGPLDKETSILNDQKARYDSTLLTLRPSVESEIKSKVGFLDELKVMYILISESGVALVVWLIWLLLLFGLELFILISKVGEKPNDYDATIKQQMDIRLKRLALLDSP